jgi:hypothetical protein
VATFTPHVGVDALVFGLSAQDVPTLLGPPKTARKTARGEISETRGPAQPRITLASDRLVELSYMPAAGALVLHDEDLFAGEGLLHLRRMQASYGPLFTHVGFVLCLDAGIAFTGFHDGNLAQKAVTVFERGRWDRFAGHLAPIVLH